MNVPSATYRVQFSSSFTFKDLVKIIPYLHALGISTLYASPVFESRKGSTHGYDVTNPLNINPEIGTLDELYEINQALKKNNMTWLQDIVPNHMAYDYKNELLRNVLEMGPNSAFYNFFDIDWHYPKEGFQGKVMAPFLGGDIEKIMRKEELTLSFNRQGFYFNYYAQKYPASRRSYALILSYVRKVLKNQFSENSSVYENLKELSANDTEVSSDVEKWKEQKETLYDLSSRYKDVADAITSALKRVNASPKRLKKVLDEQYFCLTHWKSTEEEINYRRFFTINDLICLRMEDEDVFNYYHQFIKKLCDEDLINGLRIDHIDGLFDPATYLERLRRIIGEDRYLIIEKILEWEERLPLQWPIQGTSGYAFLGIVNNLFTRSDQERKFSSAYRQLNPAEYHDLIYEKKAFILKEKMGGELSNLYELMVKKDLLPEGKYKRDKLIEALTGFLAAFPVYRIYPYHFPLTYRQREVIMQAYETATSKMPKLQEALDHLLSIFMGEAPKPTEQMTFFLQRCQQFTGPLAAKGVEDTSFYIYNRLISHNEVGDSPHVFGISSEEFHKSMLQRSLHFPFSINATATHDTKRGEDARMRINALSEIPNEWFDKVDQWRRLNAPVRKSKKAPDDNEEYFIYQTLIGGWPADEMPDDTFADRTKAYLMKVLREAKQHSDWSAPDEDYEQAVLDFIQGAIQNKPFRESFDPFCRKLVFIGAIYSLGQCLIKITAPGVPDIYQGTELWDLSYVDPDNRRPVNYLQRMEYLEALSADGVGPDLPALLQHYDDGRIKMFTLLRALRERQSNQEIFNRGKYISLAAEGKHQENIIAYARRLERNWYIIIVPKFLMSLITEGQFPLGDVWQDSSIPLPEKAAQEWTDVFTGRTLTAKDSVFLRDALSEFPVALLKGITS